MVVLFFTQWHENAVQYPIQWGEDNIVHNYPGLEWVQWGVRTTRNHEIKLYYTSIPQVDNLVPLAQITDQYWSIYARAFELYLRDKEFVTIQEGGGRVAKFIEPNRTRLSGSQIFDRNDQENS